MATDSNTLLSETNCFACLAPGQWQLLKLGLLKQILNEVGKGAKGQGKK